MRPLFGPDRGSDVYPLTEAAEVAASRRVLIPTAPGADPDWLSEIEAFDSAAELGAARDREFWGDAPFEGD